MVTLLLPFSVRQAFADRLAKDAPKVDFAAPKGESALVAADSLSWRVFKNPVALFVGGIAAVILELAEPRVRSGVWDHSSFPRDPTTRMVRTGMAAMVTVYAARSVAERMIARVRQVHGHVHGQTPSGITYEANDTKLLDWVQATASFGFLEAYCTYVRWLPADVCDYFYAEGTAASALYGATGAPRSVAQQKALFETMRCVLEPSPILFKFLQIVNDAALLPLPLRPFQRLLTRAAVDIVPREIRILLELDERYGLNGMERALVRIVGTVADRLVLPDAPPVQACIRLGLPRDYLYSRQPQSFRV